MTTLLLTYSIVALAALIHASFQLSTSTFTLMSGHHLGKGRSQKQLVNLIGGFLLGVVAMTTLLICSTGFILQATSRYIEPSILWSAACGLAFGIGVAVWMFYYPKKSKGTTLWLPRKTAEYLAERSKKTSNTSEAFGLGLSSVFGELVFIIAPLFIAAMSLIGRNPLEQLGGVALYVGVSSLTIIVVAGLIGGGHKISEIQKWREKNKTFLQFAAGSGLLALGFSIYVDQILTIVRASGGMGL